MRRKFGFVFCSIVLGFVTTTRAATTQPIAQGIQIDQVMTKEEEKSTGIAKLSPKEREALEKWLLRFARVAMEIGEKNFHNIPAAYGGVNHEHWIKTVIEAGKVFQLEDGSIWLISPLNNVDAMIWIVTEKMVVVDSGDPIYPYKLINEDGNSTAGAKLISR
jgi:hypothetical protein